LLSSAGFHWAAHFDLQRLRKLQISNGMPGRHKPSNYLAFCEAKRSVFSNTVVLWRFDDAISAALY
jgi:hypothetical protein